MAPPGGSSELWSEGFRGASEAAVGVVEIVWARPHTSARLTAMLNDLERARLGSLGSSAVRDRFVAGHALLRLVAAGCWSLDPVAVALNFTCGRCGGPHGPPVAVPPPGFAPVHLSLAHAGNRVLVAASRLGPVGVDVEAVAGAAFAGFDDVALSMRERAWLAELGPADADSGRARVWVRKESVLKATGDGLSRDPRLVVVSPPFRRPRVLEWPEERSPSVAQLTELDVGHGYAACLTQLAEHPARVEVRRADDWLRG
jgi:4'-phosphopantetheinyl transferase